MSTSISPDAMELLREFDPEKLTQEVIKLGEDWADADAAASALEETKKSELSRLIVLTLETKLSSSGKPISVAQAENQALSDTLYTDHLARMIEARKVANKLRIRYDMGRMKLELYRSLQATLRNEMSLSRGR